MSRRLREPGIVAHADLLTVVEAERLLEPQDEGTERLDLAKFAAQLRENRLPPGVVSARSSYPEARCTSPPDSVKWMLCLWCLS